MLAQSAGFHFEERFEKQILPSLSWVVGFTKIWPKIVVLGRHNTNVGLLVRPLNKMIEWNTKTFSSIIWILLLNDFETTNLGKVLQSKKNWIRIKNPKALNNSYVVF